MRNLDSTFVEIAKNRPAEFAQMVEICKKRKLYMRMSMAKQIEWCIPMIPDFFVACNAVGRVLVYYPISDKDRKVIFVV